MKKAWRKCTCNAFSRTNSSDCRHASLNSQHKQSGFSLIEILTVLVIVGVLATIGIPSYHKLMEQQDINSVSQTLARQTSAMRVIAQSQSVPIKICPVAASDYGAAQPRCLPNATARWPAWVWVNSSTGSVIERGIEVPTGVAITVSNPQFGFDARGQLVSSSNQSEVISVEALSEDLIPTIKALDTPATSNTISALVSVSDAAGVELGVEP